MEINYTHWGDITWYTCGKCGTRHSAFENCNTLTFTTNDWTWYCSQCNALHMFGQECWGVGGNTSTNQYCHVCGTFYTGEHDCLVLKRKQLDRIEERLEFLTGNSENLGILIESLGKLGYHVFVRYDPLRKNNNWTVMIEEDLTDATREYKSSYYAGNGNFNPWVGNRRDCDSLEEVVDFLQEAWEAISEIR